MSLLQFSLTSSGAYSALFRDRGIYDFHAACAFVQQLPYGRNSDRADFSLILTEGKGSCSGKHALLAALAEENGQTEIELIAGIFLMSPETHPVLEDFFSDKPYTAIPECHCYLRYKGERFDFTDNNDGMSRIAPKIVREQRIEPQQVVDWKPVIHKHYLEGWLKRNPQLPFTPEEMWNEREQCIRIFAR